MVEQKEEYVVRKLVHGEPGLGNERYEIGREQRRGARSILVQLQEQGRERWCEILREEGMRLGCLRKKRGFGWIIGGGCWPLLMEQRMKPGCSPPNSPSTSTPALSQIPLSPHGLPHSSLSLLTGSHTFVFLSSWVSCLAWSSSLSPPFHKCRHSARHHPLCETPGTTPIPLLLFSFFVKALVPRLRLRPCIPFFISLPSSQPMATTTHL